MTRYLLALLMLAYGPLFAAEPVPHGPYCEVLGSQGVQAVETEREPVSASVALGRVVDQATEAQWAHVASAARRMEAEYRMLGLDILFTPYLVTADCTTGLRGNCFEYLPSEGHTHWHIWGGFQSGLCGQAELGGRKAWTSIACQLPTLLHEQGHNFRLHHSGEGGWQYGWKTWMGAGSGRGEYNAQNARVLGVPLAVESGLGRHFIASAYAPAYDGEVQLVGQGQYFASAWRGQLAVSRREPVSSSSDSQTWLLAMLQEGERARISGTTYEFQAAHRGALDLVVREDGEQPDLAEWPAPSSEQPHDPVAGLWAPVDASHQGLLIYVGPRGLNAYWMTWARSEAPRWYLVQGTPGDLQIYRTAATLREREVIPAGDGQIRFLSGTEAVFDFWIDEQPRGRLELERITSSVDHPLAGHWDLGGLTGLVTQVTPQGDVFGFWLTYDIPQTALLPSGPNQTWRMLYGQPGGMLRLYEPAHGFPGVGIRSRLDEWGDARFDGNLMQWSGEDMGSAQAVKLL